MSREIRNIIFGLPEVGSNGKRRNVLPEIPVADYYVAVDGLDTNPGTITQPWKSKIISKK